MASRYWVGGTGTWDASATTHWSAASGGSSGASAPTSADDVFLDANSGTGTVTLASGAVCHNLDCTGYTGTLSHSSAATLNHSGTVFKLVAGMTYTLGGTSQINFNSTSGTTAITTAGKSLGRLIVQGAGGTFQLQDNLTSTLAVTLSSGVLDLNGKTLTATAFTSTSSNARELRAAGATAVVTGTGSVWSITPNATFTATGFSTLTLNVTDTSSSSKTIADTSLAKIGTVNITAGGTGAITINGLTAGTFSVTGPKTISIGSSGTPRFDSLALAGSSGNRITWQSSSSGTARAVFVTNKCLPHYTDFTDAVFRGATVEAVDNCTGSNVQGIAFRAIAPMMGAFVGVG